MRSAPASAPERETINPYSSFAVEEGRHYRPLALRSAPARRTAARCASDGSRGFGSASVFSMIIESYWSIESSSVFALRTTSRWKKLAQRRGRRECFESSGCQLSAATPFSEVTQTPSWVLSSNEWLPSVCPGVQISETPGPSSMSPSRQDDVSGHAAQALRRRTRPTASGASTRTVATSLRCAISFAFGNSGAHAPRGPAAARVEPRIIRTSWTWRWSKLT